MTREFKVGMTGKTTTGYAYHITREPDEDGFVRADIDGRTVNFNVETRSLWGGSTSRLEIGDLIHPDDAKEESGKSSSGSDGAHTPGPWETGEASWNEDGEVRYTLHGVYEAKAADARLIGAAPDLLHALQMCVIERSEWLDEARRAIDKATRRRSTGASI